MSLRRRARPWGLLLLVWALLGAALATWAWAERARIEALELERLRSQARVVDVNLTRQVEAIAHSLDVVDELARVAQDGPKALAAAELTLAQLESAMPTVRTFLVTDAAGRTWLSNRPELIGQDFSNRAYVQRARAQTEPGRLAVSPPFRSVLGVYVLALSRARFDAQGRFAGALVAVVEPADIGLLLDSVRYADDVQAELRHGAGARFVSRPTHPSDTASPLEPVQSAEQSAWAAHQASARALSALRSTGDSDDTAQLIVLQTVAPAALRMDAPLVVELTRPWRGVIAPWLRNVQVGALLYAVLGGLAGVGLVFYLRQRAARVVNAKRLKLATEASGVGIWEFDLHTKRYYWDPAMYALFGLDPRTVSFRLNDWQRLLSVEDLARMREATRQSIHSEQPFDLTFAIHRPDGSVRFMRNRAALYADDDGQPRRLIGSTEDVTERKRIEADQRVAAVAFESKEALLVTNAAVEILRVNRAFTELFGYAASALLGRNPRLFKSGRHGGDFYAALWADLDQHQHWSGEIWNTRASGEELPCEVVITAVCDEVGAVTHFVASYTDITLRKASEEEVRRLAFFDPLTQLPNRRLLTDRLRQALARVRRDKGHAGLIYVDLDLFKPVNDRFGHAAGDHLLQAVAHRLFACVRETDTVARVGGDEFVVLLSEINYTDDALRVADKIHTALLQPFTLPGGQTVHISSSAGVAIAPAHGDDEATLSRHADAAMYAAKARGRDTYVLFEPPTPMPAPAPEAQKL